MGAISSYMRRHVQIKHAVDTRNQTCVLRCMLLSDHFIYFSDFLGSFASDFRPAPPPRRCSSSSSTRALHLLLLRGSPSSAVSSAVSSADAPSAKRRPWSGDHTGAVRAHGQVQCPAPDGCATLAAAEQLLHGLGRAPPTVSLVDGVGRQQLSRTSAPLGTE